MKVLISAYACEPHKGSEPGAGWNWSLAAARDHEVWVLTRANNRKPIEAELARNPVPHIHFVYVDLPAWAKRWKKGQRGVRLYYTLWQFAALRAARELHERERFDVVHHLTFANMWLPALVGRLDVPFVYGPVGGGVSVPLRLYPELGLRGMLAEVRLEVLRALACLSPAVRRTWRDADLVVAQNEETAHRLGRRVGAPVVVRPNASVVGDVPERRQVGRSGKRRHAMCAGRLQPWKGASLAIKAIAATEDWTLEIVGRGTDERRLRRLVRSLAVEDRVTFTPWLPQHELWARLASVDALILASLREESSLVLAEAASVGVPVLAFDHGGPAAIAGLVPGAVELVPRRDGARAIAVALEAVRATERSSAPSRVGAGVRAATLSDWYARIGRRATFGDAPRRPARVSAEGRST